jgi:hypothetical protein
MRGGLKFTKRKLSKNQKADHLVLGAKNLSYSKAYFFFMNELLVWKEKPGSTDILGRVFLVNITSVGIGDTDIFYFVVSKNSIDKKSLINFLNKINNIRLEE